MTESRNTEQEKDVNRVLSFGERLYVERKKQNLSVADVAKAIHLAEKVIDAIERSDVDQLPQPTFVQGYLRAYAKYLGVSDALILEEYEQAIPHQQDITLNPRSSLPGEASSNSPFVKTITVLLLVLMVAAALYASFDYYKNAIVANDTELHDQASLSLPDEESFEQVNMEDDILSGSVEQVDIKQNVEEPEPEQEAVTSTEVDAPELPTNIIKESDKESVEEQVVDTVVLNDSVNQKPTNQLNAKGDDDLELSATQVSWIEVDDANSENLYYDLLQKDQSIMLKGTAPFKIFLGNAPQVKVKINDVSVNIEKYIRSNNIAHFSISVDQQQVVFH